MTKQDTSGIEILRGKKTGKYAVSLNGKLIGTPDGFGFDILATFRIPPQNTPDTEWEKEFNRRFSNLIQEDWYGAGIDASVAKTKATILVKDFITNLLSSRDTYWKERVRDIRFMDLPEIVLTKEECKKRGIETEWDFTVFVKRGDVDTLLDNLK